MKITQAAALERIASRIRMDIVQEVYYGKSGHLGGALSCADILSVLYFNEMNINPNEPHALNRDRFVLSKGHASAALYATLAEKGFITKDELLTFRNIESNLQGHPDMNKVPGVDMTSGSLGQGLSVANGMALSKKVSNEKGYVYCLVGDGEIEEGQIWEACMTSNKYALNNLILFVDNNSLQIDGNIKDVKNVDNLDDKFKSFGFNVQNIDGHDFNEIINAIDTAKKSNKPNVIIAKTIKGKGIPFMENEVSWHGKKLTEEDYKNAMEYLK